MKRMCLYFCVILFLASCARSRPGYVTISNAVVRDSDGVIIQTIRTESKSFPRNVRGFKVDVQ